MDANLRFSVSDFRQVEFMSNDETASMGEPEEPRLKYSKLTNMQDILQTDVISCLAVSDRFIAIGTHQGAVHLMDMIGTPIKQLKSHSASIHQIDIDNNEEYVGTASADGNTIVSSLYTSEQTIVNFKRPVTGIALEPDYSKKATRQFLSGGKSGQLILNGKGWFGNSQTILDSCGTIFSLAWRGNYVVYSNEQVQHAHLGGRCF